MDAIVFAETSGDFIATNCVAPIYKNDLNARHLLVHY